MCSTKISGLNDIPSHLSFSEAEYYSYRIWLNIVSQMLFLFAFGHFQKTNVICIRIQPKIWIRIIFVFVFSSENTISSPLFLSNWFHHHWTAKLSIYVLTYIYVYVYKYTHTYNRVTQEMFHILKTNSYCFHSNGG